MCCASEQMGMKAICLSPFTIHAYLFRFSSGTVNRSGFKQLGDPESWPSNLPCPILIQDVPHLLKRIRNAMINHEVLINGTTRISWHAIDDLYKQSEQNEGLRLVQHLTKDARSPDAWAKMRVPLARAVLCRKTAHALEHYCTHPDAKGTASFIRQVDTFYSIMTDARPFTKDSITEGGADTRLKQLQGVLEYFEDWKVRVDAEVAAIRANQTLTAKDRAAAIKTVKSHFIAMESFDDLKLTISNFTAATRLLLTRFPFMRVYPRSFSTNCLESYFALARALGRSSTKVTARQMKLVAVSYQLIGHLRSFMSQLKTNYDPITELNMGGVQADTQGGTAQASTAPAQTTIDAAAVVASDLVPPVSVDVESDQMPARASGTESGDEEWEALMDMVNDEEDERLIYELSKLLLADDLTDKEKVDVKEMLDKMLSDVL
ncbi:hypothetical protein BCR44DRAFT_224064 [Catenaria anguillulae PL171]|uniref:Transposable element P transposase-like GTP-binding insertion domain-containing protein n=1 Tax=Catenaria anguillulae PL171 TaxID=765915 RepID=A0A1Y2HA51_9FUNG|nr:hypothetical protein BCR44DRAFT_224064 [Catenaria anguillulae PL171]